MARIAPRTGEIRDRVRIAAYRGLKAVAQLRYPRHNPDRRHVFILGMQRSGTTTLVRVFERDFRTRVFQEHSRLSDQDIEKNIRLNPLPDVAKALGKERAPVIVLKPLVESQKAPQLLERFDHALAIWCFRHFEAVAQSNVRQFGDRGGKNNLRPILRRDRSNWRAELVPPDVEATVDRLYSENMTQLDAAALFWWVRNRLFFDLGLHADGRVHLVRFERFVSDPRAAMQAVYERMGLPYPRNDIIAAVDHRVARHDRRVGLNSEIAALCESLWERLTAVDDAF